MNRTLLFLVILHPSSLILSTVAAPTNTTVTVNQVTYHDVRWGDATASGVTIFHKSGVAVLPLESLPADLRAQFNFDPQAAAAERRQRAIADANRRAQIAKAQSQAKAAREKIESDKAAAAGCDRQWAWRAKVIQVLDDGMLVQPYQVAENQGPTPYPQSVLSEPTWFVSPAYDVVDDQWIIFYGERDGNYSYETTLGAKRTVEHWRACKVNTLY